MSPYSFWYLGESSAQHLQQSFVAFFTFLILFNNFIPISLYVSIEFIKFAQGWLLDRQALILP